MTRRSIEIGLLFSRSGSYSLVSQAGRMGALKAIEAVNADPAMDVTFAAVERDPGGNIDAYQPLCAEILETTSARHLIGTTTSWSRKEIIPTLERAGGMLWYPCPYEGFEASDHVIYTHACPNQHLVPLLEWAVPRLGGRGYLVGSNYIWGWESSRVARDRIQAAGGSVLAERYLPIGDTDVTRVLGEIFATQPDFILNSLIGESSYRFLAGMKSMPSPPPVLSCNLTECELPALGDSGEGVIAAGPYFRGAQGWPHADGAEFESSFEAAAYLAVRILAGLLSHRPRSETLRLRDLVTPAAAARYGIDPATNHLALPALIAELRGGQFHILSRREGVSPDPYLSRSPPDPATRRPRLTVVAP
jgi:ABC-type branched-subunit amino acid transport system substrate-binding protein